MRGEAVVRVRLEDLGAPVDEAHGVLVREHHALRLAGGARGVEDVREVGATRRERCACRRRCFRIRLIERLPQGSSRAGLSGQDQRRVRSQLLQLRPELRIEAALHDDCLDRAVLQDVGVARRRRAGVDRHVRGAGLQDAVDRCDGVDGLPHVDPDAVAGTHSDRAKPVPEAIGKRRQLAVGDRAAARLDDRDALREAASGVDEVLVQCVRRFHGEASGSLKRSGARCRRACPGARG